MTPTVLAFGFPGSWEWILILIVALLIFGRRLPDVARSVGKSIVEFKRGIKDVHDDIEGQSRGEPSSPSKLEDKAESKVAPTSEPAVKSEPNRDAQPTNETPRASG